MRLSMNAAIREGFIRSARWPEGPQSNTVSGGGYLRFFMKTVWCKLRPLQAFPDAINRGGTVLGSCAFPGNSRAERSPWAIKAWAKTCGYRPRWWTIGGDRFYSHAWVQKPSAEMGYDHHRSAGHYRTCNNLSGLFRLSVFFCCCTVVEAESGQI